MDTSIFTFPTDFAGEGTLDVIARVKEAGINGVLLAANYHAARDVFPHNPRYRVHAMTSGALFMHAPRAKGTLIGSLCLEGPVATGECALPALAAALVQADLRVEAWCNYCHLDNWSLPDDVVCRNVFGDPDNAIICPSNPAVGDFAEALTRDVAAAGAQEILAEALHFAPLVHGYHHERWISEVSELAQFLLGLCFCRSCRAGMQSAGVHVGSLESSIRKCVDHELSLQGQPAAGRAPDAWLTMDELTAAVGEELLGLLAYRTAVVDELYARVAATAAESKTVLRRVDPSGAIKGYVTGTTTKMAGPVPSWLAGTGSDGLGGTAELGILAYASSVDRVRAEIAAYAALVDDISQLAVVLRPSRPDCRDGGDLREKVSACREAGVGKVSFYHYAFMPLVAFQWARDALEVTRRGQ